MSSLVTVWGVGAAAVLAAMVLLWLVSLLRRDASIVDIFWSLGFVGVAWVYRAHGGDPTPRQLLALVLVTVWGVRLAAHIAWRGRGHGEDYRYQAMRRHHGESFAWVSLFTVFLLQGVLLVAIAVPHLLIQVPETDPAWRWSDALGLLLWTVGFFFEAVGDWQLLRFKADPSNRGKVLDRSLWAYTRHPNYFDDALVWWGYYAFALASPGGVWTFPAPLLMTVLLLKVSGVALLEKTIAKRRPEYAAYVERTSAFVPWPPRAKPSSGR